MVYRMIVLRLAGVDTNIVFGEANKKPLQVSFCNEGYVKVYWGSSCTDPYHHRLTTHRDSSDGGSDRIVVEYDYLRRL